MSESRQKNTKNQKKELSKNEETLYDLFLSEYNDLFENMLNSNYEYIFSKITKNISYLIGKEKYDTYPPELIKKFKKKLYNECIHPDLVLIEKIKNNIEQNISPLDIDTIYAHCEKCYDCLHICGQKLYTVKDSNLIICKKCNKIYKNNMIRLLCQSCNEEYFSYVINEKNIPVQKEDFIPVTWAKYHCENYISEEMKCPNCSSNIYFSDSKKLLKCFDCNWESKAKDQRWTCEICGKKFQSELKEYYKYETKPLLNCIKYAIIKKIIVKPYKVDCCNLDPLKISFYHNKKEGCNGKLYLSFLNKRPVIVCSKCKTIKEVPDMVWDCPNCQSKFNCNGIIYIQKKKKKIFGKNINKHHQLNRTGSHNNIYKKEISSNFIIRNKKTFEESINDNDENSNFNSPSNDNIKLVKKSKLKRIKNSMNKIKRKELDFISANPNNSFIEIRNITPQKEIFGDFIVNEAGYFTKNNFKEKYDISKENNEFFSNSKKSNSKEITRNNTMINIKSEQNKKTGNFKRSNNNNKNKDGEKEKENQNEPSSFSEGNKMKLNFCFNLNMNRNNSRQQFEPNMIKNYELKEEDYIDDKVNSNSVNNNEMKLVKRRLAFMEPTPKIDPEEYEILDKIGHGSFGKIYSVKWGKNGKQYAMKILKLTREKDLENYKNKLNILINFIKKTNCKNVVKVYGTLYEKLEEKYKCYVLMELAKTDWEVEIKYRSKHQLFYTEIELMNIIKQLIQCYALLQKCNITHRDVKPQNILVVNDLYKICDFGEAMITHGKNGFIHQPIRGSELYMSPILFDALNSHKRDIIHNTYKSDVFSLGMCIFFAATLTFQSLYDIREIKDMEVIENVVGNYLYPHYSEDIVDILFRMLQIEEKKRPDFIQLERMINF